MKFVSTLRKLGFGVEAGEDEYGNANLDDSTIIVSWELGPHAAGPTGVRIWREVPRTYAFFSVGSPTMP